MKREYKTVEELKTSNEELVEVELMLTPKELREFANYCINNDIKFNDWVRQLAYEKLDSSS